MSYSVRVRLCARVCLCVRAAEAAAEVKTLDFAFFLFICSALRLAFVAERSENKNKNREPGLAPKAHNHRPLGAPHQKETATQTTMATWRDALFVISR